MRATRDRPRSGRRTPHLLRRRSVQGAPSHRTQQRRDPTNRPRSDAGDRTSFRAAARQSPPPIDITRALLLALLIAFLTMTALPFLLESAAAPYR